MAITTLMHDLQMVCDNDGAVILDVKRDAMVTLNPTGAFVWERLRRGDSLDIIVRALAETTGTEAREIESDVRSFVEELTEKRLMPR